VLLSLEQDSLKSSRRL